MTKFDTHFPADCLEFCPHSELTDIFVCGTYKLDEDQSSQLESLPPSAQHRRGQCLLFSVDKSSFEDGAGLHQLQVIDLPAVPDMKWNHRSEASAPILGVADSEGNITIYEWRTTERILERINAFVCAPSDTLCLSLDWSNRRASTTGLGSLIVSLSNGSLCLLDMVEGAGLSMTKSWHAHDYEPWIAAWDHWDTNIIYSVGGDDLKFKSWDIRQGFGQPVFVNRRFDAGVTAIQCHPHIEHLIAVGSYNNTVQLFDARKPLVPLTQVDVGGGAWRVKWHPCHHAKRFACGLYA
ncbi:WD40-repeat-containing domain protein [Infundibulicybe gibba]|nr:WD40-repeat-containing domain protein [Infundibulicybe gibba]